MNHAVTLRELSGLTPCQWDQVTGRYSNATIFHSSCWHEFLNQSLPGHVVHFQIDVNQRTCGHWCGFLIKKFGMRVFGAPLPGTATDYMHPLFLDTPPVGDFLTAVRRWAVDRRISMVEVGGEYFDAESLSTANYRLQYRRTYRVTLAGGEDAVWRRLKPAMRNKVRKAEKNRVTVIEDWSPDFPGQFFRMLQAVFNRQGKAPTYSLRRIETVVRVLKECGCLVPLMALRDDEPLASVILLLDDRTAYYWGGASYETAYGFGANDIIQWRALQLAISKGLVNYDACGGGEYKEKFGGELIPLPAGYLSINPVFGLVRTSLAAGFRAKQVLAGAVQRAAGAWR
jgi:hypothetical protein